MKERIGQIFVSIVKLVLFMQTRLSRVPVRLCASFCALAALCVSLCAGIDPKNLPKPTGYVSDLAHVIDPESESVLEDFCTKVERQLGVQFAFVTIDTIGDQPIRDFALDLA